MQRRVCSGASDRVSDEGWLERLKVFAFLTIYVTGLWGEAGRFLPESLNDWHGIPHRLLGQWWQTHVLPQLAYTEQIALFNVAVSYLLALGAPLCALRLLGISASTAGLGRPRSHGTCGAPSRYASRQ